MTKRRSGLGNVGTLLAAARGGNITPAKATEPPTTDKDLRKDGTPRKRSYKKTSVWLRPETIEESKNVVDALSGPPLRLTFTNLLHNALTREIARLQKQRNGGKPFPQRPTDHANLKTGSRSK